MLSHIDCFAGVGGVATGFHAAGIQTNLAIEKVDSCVETYRANHKSVEVIHDDIRNVSSDFLRKNYSKVDIVTAGMPCETFSTAGSSSRSFYDHRQTLFDEAIRIACAVDARVLLFENVPGFANKRLEKESPELVFDLLIRRLNEEGYRNIISGILNAKDFGVPQSRQRLFVLAAKDNSFELSLPKATNVSVTVSEAFANLELVDTNNALVGDRFTNVTNKYCKLMGDSFFWNLGGSPNCTYQRSPKHRDRTIKRFELIRAGEGLKSLFDRLDASEVQRLQTAGILPKKWYIQRNRRLVGHEVSPTVTSHCLDELLHPKLNRSITVREAARLQSFPDAYDFVGGPEICPHMYETQDKYEQIGDAVPPLMAYYWAQQLKKLLGRQSDLDESRISSVMR